MDRLQERAVVKGMVEPTYYEWGDGKKKKEKGILIGVKVRRTRMSERVRGDKQLFTEVHTHFFKLINNKLSISPSKMCIFS